MDPEHGTHRIATIPPRNSAPKVPGTSTIFNATGREDKREGE